MKRFIVALVAYCLLIVCQLAKAQLTDSTRQSFFVTRTGQYNPSRTLVFDLLHTKLDLRFDWSRQHVLGTATLRLKPYFYAQDTLALDARGFDIRSVVLIDTVNRGKVEPLQYNYADQRVLRIKLPRTYTRRDTLDIRIVYVAKPNELPAGGSAAITSDKGLYFIKPDGSEPNKPRQIWTQGETQANSAWFPTIDTPNEKMTQDISLTVEDKYRTLSNGLLISSKRSNNGTRTDRWVQTKPHAPYLTMIAVGDFAYVKDQLPKTRDRPGLEVSYYVEPAYEKYARDIFGRTPAMITFFEKLFGVPYSWDKYSQITVRDYVSGAMENTTATIFNEGVQADARQLLDGNSDAVIAHELSHHWFGDLVTCESWANLPLNEAFATYAEYLWFEHALGKDEADLHGQSDLLQYLSEAEIKQEPLIRYRYADREDMFDAHSYQKGGRVLHYLRKIVGDDAFFLALNKYLIDHRFGTAELADLRGAFEAVTGQDLNWFFSQWFLSPGHAIVKVEPVYEPGKITLNVSQTQDAIFTPIYRLPVKVDVWVKGNKTSYNVIVDSVRQAVSFPAEQRPDLVIFDADHRIVGRVEQAKTRKELMFQYQHAGDFFDKYEAISQLSDKTAMHDSTVCDLMLTALNDSFWFIRQGVVQAFAGYNGPRAAEVEGRIGTIARRDPKSSVRVEAVRALVSFRNRISSNKGSAAVLRAALNDSSYAVVSTALEAYLATKPADAGQVVERFANVRNGEILTAVAEYYAEQADPTRLDWFVNELRLLKPQEQYNFLQVFGKYLLRSKIEVQRRAIPLLESIARQDVNYSVRFGAYQALGLLLDVKGVEAIRRNIRVKERDPRLKAMYEQIGE